MEIKIYYNRRYIKLTDETSKKSVLMHINEDIIKFFTKKGDENVIIHTSTVNETLENIKMFFKYIEAAGCLVFNEKNELLVIKRLGYNDLPKGKIEKNETPEYAAVREVEEECGISNLVFEQELEPSYHIYDLNDKIVLKKTFWYKMKYSGNEKLTAQESEDITDVFWAKNTDKNTILENTYSNLIYYFENYL